jgi:hypothetical protein
VVERASSGFEVEREVDALREWEGVGGILPEDRVHDLLEQLHLELREQCLESGKGKESVDLSHKETTFVGAQSSLN